MLNKITELIKEYGATSSSMSVDELLNLQDKLSGYSYFLAEKCAETKSLYNISYFNRNICVLRRQQDLIMKSSLPVSKSEIQAKNEAEELYRTTADYESEAYRLDLLLKQVNRILASMQQRISHLKNEKNNLT